MRVIPWSAIKAEHLEAKLTGGEVCELAFNDPVKRELQDAVEFLAPIRVKGKPTHLLAVSPGAQRRQLLDSEIGFVRVIAGQVSSRLEALQFETEKADRQNTDESLPSLILQPIVENALKHGLSPKIGAGNLRIDARREGDFLSVAVEDDGPGFPQLSPVGASGSETSHVVTERHEVQTRKTNGNGVGLRNVTERLATIYAGRARILFERGANDGTRVTLLLPRPIREMI